MTLKGFCIKALDYLIVVAVIIFLVPFGIAVAIAVFVFGLSLLVVTLLGTPLYFLYKWKDDIRYL